MKTIQAFNLKIDDTFVYTDRLYRVNFVPLTSNPNHLWVVCIAKKTGEKWTKVVSTNEQKFNPNWFVQPVSVKEEYTLTLIDI